MLDNVGYCGIITHSEVFLERAGGGDVLFALELRRHSGEVFYFEGLLFFSSSRKRCLRLGWIF